MRRKWAIFVGALLAACGSRSGLLLSEPALDAGDGAPPLVDAAHDAAPADGAPPDVAPPDAPPPDGGCPAPSPIVLATDAEYRLELGGDYVYYANIDGNEVRRVHKCGGLPISLAGGESEARDLALAAGFVYYSIAHGAGGIKRVPLEGGWSNWVYGPVEQVERIRADEQHVFFTNTQSELNRIELGGGPVTTLATGLEAREIALGDGFVYFVKQGAIVRVPKAGGPESAVMPAEWFVDGIVVQGQVLFFSEAHGARVMRGEIGQAPAAIWSDSSDNGFAIAVDDSRVYVSAHTSGRVLSVPKLGGPVELFADDQPVTEEVAVDESSVYWISFENKTLMRRDK